MKIRDVKIFIRSKVKFMIEPTHIPSGAQIGKINVLFYLIGWISIYGMQNI